MKRFLALLLSILMVFSLVPFASAQEETTVETDEEISVEQEEAGALDWILDLPVWTLGPAAKITKIALKLVKTVVKIAMILGIVETDEIIQQIVDLINDVKIPAEEGTTVAAVA